MRYFYQVLALLYVSSTLTFLPLNVEARGRDSTFHDNIRTVHQTRGDEETYTQPLPGGGRGSMIVVGRLTHEHIVAPLIRGTFIKETNEKLAELGIDMKAVGEMTEKVAIGSLVTAIKVDRKIREIEKDFFQKMRKFFRI